MARYILLSIEDNAEAKRFVDEFDPGEGTISIRAVYAKPTKFCECVQGEKGMRPFTRGAKSGWWVCSMCGRPTEHWARGNHWASSLGRNLLKGNTDWVPMGWGLQDLKNRSGANIIPTGSMTKPQPEAELRKSRRAARRALREKH